MNGWAIAALVYAFVGGMMVNYELRLNRKALHPVRTRWTDVAIIFFIGPLCLALAGINGWAIAVLVYAFVGALMVEYELRLNRKALHPVRTRWTDVAIIFFAGPLGLVLAALLGTWRSIRKALR